MTQENQDFSMYSGDDHEITFTITNAAGSPQSLTGATAIKWQVPGFIEKTLDDGISLVDVDDTDDGVKVVLVPADTADMKGKYNHELEAVDVSNKKSTLATGVLTVKEDLIT